MHKNKLKIYKLEKRCQRWLYEIYAYGNIIAEYVNKQKKKKIKLQNYWASVHTAERRLSTEWADKKGSREKNMFFFSDSKCKAIGLHLDWEQLTSQTHP